MDRRERMKDMTLMLDSAFQGLQSGIWTALPVQYVEAGAEVGTANVQPTVQGRFLQQDGETWGPWVNLPVCLDCPISWPGGKRGRLVFPLVAGDEGILIFASRAIDNWWLQGGPQPPSMIRMHDLSDGMFIPGIFSQPSKPVATTPPANMRLTSDDGLTYVELDDVDKIINLVAPGGVVITAPVTFPDPVTFDGDVVVNGSITAADGMDVTGDLDITGDLAVTGSITATADITAGFGGADQVGVRTHTHHGVAPAGGGGFNTSAPTAGT